MRTILFFAALAACSSSSTPTAGSDAGEDALAVVDAAALTDAPSAADHVDVLALHDVTTIDAPGDAGSARLRVLFIGNSYTYYNELPTMLASLGGGEGATPSRPRITVESATEGGASLQRHWEQMRQERIRMGAWDAVVLQGQSVEPIAAFQGFDSYARRFAEVARGEGARVVFFATWARRRGDAVYGQSWSGGSFEAMTQRLDNAYRLVAMNTGGELGPVGARWGAAVARHPGVGLYDPDGSHPSAAGSYLAACVLYRALTGRPVSPDAPVPQAVSTSDAALLRAIAAAP